MYHWHCLNDPILLPCLQSLIFFHVPCYYWRFPLSLLFDFSPFISKCFGLHSNLVALHLPAIFLGTLTLPHGAKPQALSMTPSVLRFSLPLRLDLQHWLVLASHSVKPQLLFTTLWKSVPPPRGLWHTKFTWQNEMQPQLPLYKSLLLCPEEALPRRFWLSQQKQRFHFLRFLIQNITWMAVIESLIPSKISWARPPNLHWS